MRVSTLSLICICAHYIHVCSGLFTSVCVCVCECACVHVYKQGLSLNLELTNFKLDWL